MLDDARPVFFSYPSGTIPQYPKRLLGDSNSKNCFNSANSDFAQTLNEDLAVAWQVMKTFCMLVNLGTQTQRLIEPELIHQTMASVIYRLLHLGFATSSLDETYRIGLLTFSYHVFLQWQDIKFAHSQCAEKFRNHIKGVMSADNLSPGFIVWLLMTGTSAFFKVEDEVWLRESLRECAGKCNIRSWKDMENSLKSYMWIALLDEKHGKEIFKLLRHLD
tara:strand:+ start:564 stop:1220 length:657 start_codon:yes stop_codon:yes gene_type:complete